MIIARIALVLLGALLFVSAASGERVLVKEVLVKASLDEVWHAWTTEEGLQFVSAQSNVELRRGGAYEWFLDLPPDANGKRGGEGARVLAYLPKEMLAFSWTFPPSIPELRDANETTQVIVRFTELADDAVRVQLTAHEWQAGEAWDAGYAYFDNAWQRVLTALRNHFDPQAENPT